MQFVITFRRKKNYFTNWKKNYWITQIIFMEITFLPNLNVPHITYKKVFFNGWKSKMVTIAGQTLA